VAQLARIWRDWQNAAPNKPDIDPTNPSFTHPAVPVRGRFVSVPNCAASRPLHLHRRRVPTVDVQPSLQGSTSAPDGSARPAIDERMEKRRSRATNAARNRRSSEGSAERSQWGRRIGLQRTLAGGAPLHPAAGPVMKNYPVPFDRPKVRGRIP